MEVGSRQHTRGGKSHVGIEESRSHVGTEEWRSHAAQGGRSRAAESQDTEQGQLPLGLGYS